jgi:hypothetical protein
MQEFFLHFTVKLLHFGKTPAFLPPPMGGAVLRGLPIRGVWQVESRRLCRSFAPDAGVLRGNAGVIFVTPASFEPTILAYNADFRGNAGMQEL